MPSPKPIVIMGAGPAGLTAAWRLINAAHDIAIWEADPSYVGGLSRTVQAPDNYRIDVGGHLFFSKSQEIVQVWKKILMDDFIEVTRQSRIYDKGKFLDYPFALSKTFKSLGFMESVRVRASLIKAKMKPVSPEASFADWVSNRFGQHLYYKYFKPYMEKLWGIPCEELGVDAAEMRLDGISLIDAFDEKVAGASSVASPRKFHYPKLGPGQMWEGAANRIFEKFGTIFFDRKVQTIHWDETGVTHITGTNQAGEFFQQEGTNFLSSLPLKELLLSLDPPPPKEVAEAARSLRHRSIVTVCLVVSREEVFPDHWIYVPDPSVKLVRIQNYKNWSVAMVPDRKLTSLGCEYFCEEGDNMWASSDYDLAQVAIRDVVKIGLVKEAEIKDAFVVRTPRALPIHDKQTKEHLKTIREWVSLFANLQPLGRNGLHCGANQDHAMMTAMYAVKNIQGGDFDCWKVTPDARYPQDSQT